MFYQIHNLLICWFCLTSYPVSTASFLHKKVGSGDWVRGYKVCPDAKLILSEVKCDAIS